MKINEVAKLVNISIRTLHYYDDIGLLKPSKINSSGYRIYDDENLKKLQQILFLRELDFSLKDIKSILNNKNFDSQEAFINHKKLLEMKRKRLDKLIGLIDKYIEGEETMSFKEFDTSEIERAKKEFEKEVKERWGNSTYYKQSKKRTDSYSKAQWEIITRENKEIFQEFAALRGENVSCDKVQNLVQRWKDFITKYYYDCSTEMLRNLADLYTSDERFKENIDKYGDNTAQFISDAIIYYCK